MDAVEVYDHLKSMPDSDRRKQRYKSDVLQDQKVMVYDRQGTECSVQAIQVEHHIDSGGMYLSLEDWARAYPSAAAEKHPDKFAVGKDGEMQPVHASPRSRSTQGS